jgi:hypothetical protein
MEYSTRYGATAPYVAFEPFHRTLTSFRQCRPGDDLKLDDHLPQSSSVRGQVITALRFFQLIDRKNRPTDRLRLILNSNERSAECRSLLRVAVADSYGISDYVSPDGEADLEVIERRIKAFSASPLVQAKNWKFFREIAAAAGIRIVRRGEGISQPRLASRDARAMPPSRPESETIATDGAYDQTSAAPKSPRAPHQEIELILKIAECLEHRESSLEDRRNAYRTIQWLARLAAAA